MKLLLLLLHVLGSVESLLFGATWIWIWMYCCFSNKIHSFQPAGSLVLFSANQKTRSTHRVWEMHLTHSAQTHRENMPRKYALNGFEMCSICDGMYECLCVGFHLNGFSAFPLCIWSVLGKQCDMRWTRPNTLEFVYLYWATRLLTYISNTVHSIFNASTTELYYSMITIIAWHSP